MTATSAVAGLMIAGTAVWTFYLVRGWVMRGDQQLMPQRKHGRRALLIWGLIAAGMPLTALGWSDILKGQLVGLLDAPLNDYPLARGGTTQAVVTDIKMSLAGAVEEPVYVGAAVLLWPHYCRRTFIGVAALSSMARALIHLYYVGAGERGVVTVALVVLWCTLWSTANLALVYWTRMLWPVVIAHGLADVLEANGISVGRISLMVPVLVTLFAGCALVFGSVHQLVDKRGRLQHGDGGRAASARCSDPAPNTVRKEQAK